MMGNVREIAVNHLLCEIQFIANYSNTSDRYITLYNFVCTLDLQCTNVIQIDKDYLDRQY